MSSLSLCYSSDQFCYCEFVTFERNCSSYNLHSQLVKLEHNFNRCIDENKAPCPITRKRTPSQSRIRTSIDLKNVCLYVTSVKQKIHRTPSTKRFLPALYDIEIYIKLVALTASIERVKNKVFFSKKQSAFTVYSKFK